MPFFLAKDFSFEAAHHLPFHDGKCARIHGHSYKATVYVSSETLIEDGPKQNMVIDYADIKKYLTPLINNYLDHHYLNDSLNLESPTAEAIARWIYDRLESDGLQGLVGVRIDETCTSRCFYTRTNYQPSILSDALTVGGVALK